MVGLDVEVGSRSFGEKTLAIATLDPGMKLLASTLLEILNMRSAPIEQSEAT
jgi:hypothetical protein